MHPDFLMVVAGAAVLSFMSWQQVRQFSFDDVVVVVSAATTTTTTSNATTTTTTTISNATTTTTTTTTTTRVTGMPKCEIDTCRYLFANGTMPLSENPPPMWTHCHCDDQFCTTTASNSTDSNNDSTVSNASTTNHVTSTTRNNSTSTTICQWSSYAIDTLLRHVNETNVCNNTAMNQTKQFFPDPYWDRYQFTDLFHQRKRPVMDSKWDNWTCPYPGSLLDEYHKASIAAGVRGGRYDLLFQLVQNRTKTKHNMQDEYTNNDDDDLPLPNTLVIHVRMGDVIDGARHSVHELLFKQQYFYHLKEQQAWNAYVKPLSYYSDLLMRKYRTPSSATYSNIVIMGSAHKGQQKDNMQATKSCQYANVLKIYFESVLAAQNNNHTTTTTVSMRLGKPPDNDIIFASHAAGYLPSGGAFSRLIQRLNQMNDAYQRKDWERLNTLGRLAEE